MSEKTRAELKEQIKVMNHNYQVIREMHERGYQYSVSEIKRLQDELEHTRKMLKIAVDALKQIKPEERKNCVLVPTQLTIQRIVNEALEQITALEQKD